MGFTVEDGTGSPRFTKNGWSSSYNPTLEKRPGYSGGLNESYQHCHIFFHREAGRVFYMGCHKSLQRANSDWRSEDHGATMTLSVAGFDGVKASAYHSPQLLHPTDKNEFYLVGLDGGANYTANGGKWFDHINFSKSDLGTIHSTACGACMIPGQQRLVIGIGRAAKGKLVIYQDGQFYRPFDGEDSERLMGICYDQDNPKYVFGGRYKNDNYGHQNNWSKINNFANSELVVMGCSLYDPAGQCLVAAAPTGSSAQKQEVWRSLDRAGSWSRVISANYNLVDPQGAPFRVHPRDRNVLFTWTPDKRGIRKWDMRNGTAVADFDLGIPNNVPVKVGNFSIDPRYPDHMFVVNVYPGTGYGLMRTTDGGMTWQSLDHLVGACNPSFLEISPVTGNIFHGGANGTDVLRPAYSDPKDLMDTSDFYPSNRIQGDYIRV
jgi:hypothetical protein